MNALLQNATKYFTKTPRTLFLVDGIGAGVTAFMLYFVLRHFNDFIGMPSPVLIYLSVIGLVLCVFSIICYLILRKQWTPFLRAIGIGNLGYCLLTTALLMIHFDELTLLGLAYFVGELGIIATLVVLELRVAKALITE